MTTMKRPPPAYPKVSSGSPRCRENLNQSTSMGGEVRTIFRPACSLNGDDREKRPGLAGTVWRLVAHASHGPVLQDQLLRLGLHLQAEVRVTLCLSRHVVQEVPLGHEGDVRVARLQAAEVRDRNCPSREACFDPRGLRML